MQNVQDVLTCMFEPDLTVVLTVVVIVITTAVSELLVH